MKLKLSTTLLAVSLTGVCMGWISDRARMQSTIAKLMQERKTREHRIYNGAWAESRCLGAIDEITGLFGPLPESDNISASADHLIVLILCMFEHVADIEFTNNELFGGTLDPGSTYTATQMLRLLDCNSPEEFFEIATSRYPNARSDPHLHDTNSAEYQQLFNFVSDALNFDYFEAMEAAR